MPVPEEELPLRLPDVQSYEPTGTGESPLAAIDDVGKLQVSVCGADAKRETNTMPQWQDLPGISCGMWIITTIRNWYQRESG